jgi:hypothetical protein
MRTLGINIFEKNSILEELTKQQKQIFLSLNLECPFKSENNNLLKKDSFLDKIVKASQSKGRGRPKGSKNKGKIKRFPDRASIKLPQLKKGRPQGKKNRQTVEAKVSSDLTSVDQPKRGRPKGSKNKPTVEPKSMPI